MRKDSDSGCHGAISQRSGVWAMAQVPAAYVWGLFNGRSNTHVAWNTWINTEPWRNSSSLELPLVCPGLQTTIQRMGVHITAIVYPRIVIIQIGSKSTTTRLGGPKSVLSFGGVGGVQTGQLASFRSLLIAWVGIVRQVSFLWAPRGCHVDSPH